MDRRQIRAGTFLQLVVIYHSICLVTALARTSPLFPLLDATTSSITLYYTMYFAVISNNKFALEVGE